MEQLLTAHMSNVLKADEPTAEESGVKGDNIKPVKSIKYKVLMLAIVAILFCIQFFREIVSSDFLMNQVFYLANNYVNASRARECSCEHKTEI